MSATSRKRKATSFTKAILHLIMFWVTALTIMIFMCAIDSIIDNGILIQWLGVISLLLIVNYIIYRYYRYPNTIRFNLPTKKE